MTIPTLAAVVLAAGASRRLGRAKQTVRFRGTPLVARAAGLALSVATGPVVVVTGAKAAATGRALEGLEVRTAHNPHWETGMASSLRTGLEAIGAVDAMLVLLCDQWAVERADLERVVAAWRGAPGRITASRWGGAGGPPAILPANVFGELARLEGDRGARAVIAARTAEVRWVEVPTAARELDDADDLTALRATEASDGAAY